MPLESQDNGDKSNERDSSGRFLPGHSPVSPGRPPGSLSLVALLREELERHVTDTSEGKEEKVSRALRLMRKVLNQAERGDRHSIKLIMNYLEGLPKQNVDVTSGGKPIPILANVHVDGGDKEDSEAEEAD